MVESSPTAGDVSPAQVRLETGAVLKLLLSQLEQCSSLPPEVAAHPHRLNEMRHQVIRRIWALVKLASKASEPVE